MSESSIEESVNLGAMGEALNDKMDRDGLNADIKPAAGYGVDYVVEWKVPTESDPSWYRKYASGWVEQGGRFDVGSDTTSNGLYTANFSITMKNTDYYASSSMGANSVDSGYGAYTSICTPRKTTSSVSFYVWKTETSYRWIYWEVKGMTA